MPLLLNKRVSPATHQRGRFWVIAILVFLLAILWSHPIE